MLPIGLLSAAYYYRDLLVATFIRAPAGVVLRPAQAGPGVRAPKSDAVVDPVSAGGSEGGAPAGQGVAPSIVPALPGPVWEIREATPLNGSLAPPVAEAPLSGEAPESPVTVEAFSPDGPGTPETAGGWPGSGSPAGPGLYHGYPEGTEEAGAGTDPEAGGAHVVIRRHSGRARVDVRLREAYAALRAGDLPAARRAYEELLREQPQHRDAHLGLAAVALREEGIEEAIRLYLEVLRLDPRDGAALAALISLHEDTDPVESVSMLRRLLGESPDAAYLSFSLGNVFARERRWVEARQAFLDAHRAERSNPGYVYNLAVSLDHLAQRERALARYRLALELAEQGLASFDAGAVRRRIRAMEQESGA